MSDIGHDQGDVVARVREFTARAISPQARELDRANRFPVELMAPMAAAGFFGIHYPAAYGGGGYGTRAACAAMTELAKGSAGVSLLFHVHWMAVDALLAFGSAEQKEGFLADMVQGRKIAAYVVSEPQAGSDVAAMSCQATAGGGGWTLNGTKYFCTNGGIADLYFVAAKTAPELGAKGISMFMIPRDTAGLMVGPAEEKLGCRSSVTTSLTLRDCFVPDGAVLGKPGEGFKVAMHGLTGGRLGVACMGLGIAEAALQSALGYANRRQAFGKPLAALTAVQQMVSDMYVKVEAARLLITQAADKRDSGGDYALESSVAKLFAAEMAAEVCHKALQVYGGHGYMKRHDVEIFYRDARLLDIGVGASEVLRSVVGATLLRKAEAGAAKAAGG